MKKKMVSLNCENTSCLYYDKGYRTCLSPYDNIFLSYDEERDCLYCCHYFSMEHFKTLHDHFHSIVVKGE